MADSGWSWRSIGAGILVVAFGLWAARAFGDHAWPLRPTDVFYAVGVISIALEIGSLWHYASWRSSLSLWDAVIQGWTWLGVALFVVLSMNALGTIGLILLGLEAWHPAVLVNPPPMDMLVQLQAVVYGLTLASTALVWRLRVWVIGRSEAGYSGWQTFKAFAKGAFVFTIHKASGVILLVNGLLGIIVGGGLLWLFLKYVPTDWLGPNAWPSIRWSFLIGFVLIAMILGSMALSGLAQALGALKGSGKLDVETHGQARLAEEYELRRAKLSPRNNGIYLGQFLNVHRPHLARDRVEYPGSVHLITIGPAGSGKGTGLIVPNLSELRRSILIIDPKGEAAAITARKRAQFGRVIIINPFNVLADTRPYLKSNGFNPLAALDPNSDNFTDDAAGIGQALVKEQPGSDGAFFGGSAQDLVTALVMHEKVKNRNAASLANVRKMLTEPFGGTERTGPIGLARTIFDMTESDCGPLRSKAGRFKSGSKSTMDIISTAINETRFLDSPSLQHDLRGAGIDWDMMKREETTIYLILPADRLETHANFLRLVVTSALRTLLRSSPSKELSSVLFMLDEFAQLGYLPPVENAMGIARGFGVQLWPFLQDLNQLKALYQDRWQTFIGNAGVLTAFAPRDLFTAQYLSSLCGNKTVIVESENERDGAAGSGRSRGPQGMPLFRPEALMAMSVGQMLSLVEPLKNPFMVRAPGYWTTDFKVGLDDNPYYRG